MSYKKLFILALMALAPNVMFAMEADPDSKRAKVINFKELYDQIRISDWMPILESCIRNLKVEDVFKMLSSEDAAELSPAQIDRLHQIAEASEGCILMLQSEPERADDLITQDINDGECNRAKKIKRVLYACKFLKKLKFPQVLFTPRPYHNANPSLDMVLEALIANEQTHISVCCYHLALYNVAEALVRQKNYDGVGVEVVTDQDQGETAPLQTLKLLVANGISLAAPKNQWREDNHHKFFIFTCNVLNKPLVWTGSYNPTAHANRDSWDNIVLLDDAESVQGFRGQFEEIKVASEPITREDLNNTPSNPKPWSLKNNNVPRHLWDQPIPEEHWNQ